MKKRLKKRLGALALTITLGVTSVMGYGRITKKVYAAEPDRIVFAEGEGTGKNFDSNSWAFDSIAVLDAGHNTTGPIPGETDKPAIVPNNYSGKNEPVMRLINGVRADNQGYEANDSYDDFRSGKAFLNEDISLNENSDFSVKFTFSMPEACVNTIQTGEEKYAREVGGDGIAFVMTTNENQAVKAGGGIGYQGMNNSLAIEMDSFFNGAYIDNNGGVSGYPNNDFDNQVIKDTNNYENVNHNERFDHIAVTYNGDIKNHKAISYINGIVPAADKLAHNNVGNTNTPSSSNDCATRFTDKGVNNRLFTVWVEYDGANQKMYVSYANGDFANAVKPATPQINGASVDLAECFNFNADRHIYMGFTSAIGTSKANHTIHAFQFTNRFEPIEKAAYKVEYYLEDPNNRGTYNIKTEDTVLEENAKALDLVNDTNYKKEYEGYDYTTVAGQSISEITVCADGTSVLKLYYKYKGEAQYKLNYYLKDKDTGEYKLNTSTEPSKGYVGDKVTVSEIDPQYANKYSEQKYALSTEHSQETEVTLSQEGVTYEMNLYYDPIIESATYRLHYWLYNPGKGAYVERTADESEVKNGVVGQTYRASDVEAGYADKYLGEHYELSTVKTQEDSVLLAEAGKNYDMNVYYDPQTARYKVNYYKLDPASGEYNFVEASDEKTGYVGKEYKVTDVDPSYGSKYDNYVVNTAKNDTYKVTLEQKDMLYEMNVYYDPSPAGYKLNYYKLNPDTEEYDYVESTTVFTAEVGKTYTITDADSGYENKYASDGYTVNAAKNEKFSVKVAESNKTYDMDVYYDPAKTTYKTQYYLEQPGGSFEMKEEITSGETYAGKTVHSDDKEFDGYKHVIIDESLEQEVVNPDGSTTLKVYYKYKNTPVYTTEYYVEQEDGTYKLYTSKVDSGTAGDEANAQIIDIDGYEHTELPDLSHETDVIKADNSTVLKVYYNKAQSPVYTVQYYIEQEDGTYKLYTEKENIEGTAGETVTAEIIDIDGYVHTTTDDSNEEDTVKADNSTVLKVYYNIIDNPVYTVQYYVEQKDGTYKLYKEEKNIEGTAGETVTAEIIKIKGYVHTETDDSNEEDVVNADGSTVLKVYYNLDEEPTDPPEDPTDPPEEPTEPTEKPTKPAETPTKPTEPTKPTKPTKPTEPTEPTEPTTETPTDETTTKETISQQTPQPTTKAPEKEIKTGDSANNSLFVMLLSAMAVAYGCFFGRKKKSE